MSVPGGWHIIQRSDNDEAQLLGSEDETYALAVSTVLFLQDLKPDDYRQGFAKVLATRRNVEIDAGGPAVQMTEPVLSETATGDLTARYRDTLIVLYLEAIESQRRGRGAPCRSDVRLAGDQGGAVTVTDERRLRPPSSGGPRRG